MGEDDAVSPMTDERRVLRLQGGPVEIDEVAGFGGSDDGIGNGQERFFGRAAGIGADGGAGAEMGFLVHPLAIVVIR